MDNWLQNDIMIPSDSTEVSTGENFVASGRLTTAAFDQLKADRKPL